MVDAALIAELDGHSVRFCVIGGVALAAHGYARYTADVDLLTMDARVLTPGFWADAPSVPTISTGDADDPLHGVVRWDAEPPHDLIVGRGWAMRHAVDTAEIDTTLGCRVATAVGLILLKLEAGAPQDRYDVLALVQAQRALHGPAWMPDVASHLPRLTEHARACWTRVVGDL